MTGRRARGWTDPAAESWAAGPWSLERIGDELADVRFEGRDVLRSVRAVARDRDWGTVPTTVTGVDRLPDALVLGLAMRERDADLIGRMRVRVDSEALRVDLELESRTAFTHNRVGLVVLHSPAVAGAPLLVTAPDGTLTTTRFPTAIAPHQPAVDIARLEWSSAGLESTLDLEGDLFEMEDQRNWTDASFKTYSTPLARPFPRVLRSGDHLRQSLVLRTATMAPAPPAPSSRAVVELVDAGRPFPAVVLGAGSGAGAGDGRRPPADALLVEVDPARPGWRAAVERAAAHGLPLDVRLVAADVDVLRGAVPLLDRLPVLRLGAFDPRTHVSEPALAEALRAVAPAGVILVGGTRAHFTELNREHHRLPALDAVTCSMTPQMHAGESRQLVESLAMQRLVARDAVRIAAGRPVHLGPITLRPRFNAVATSDSARSDSAAPADEDERDDPRQAAPELAAWTMASGIACAAPGVASIAWFELDGSRGIRSEGAELPAARAVADLHRLAGLPVLEDPDVGRLGVWVIAARRGLDTVVLAAETAGRPAELLLRLPDGRTTELHLAPLSIRRVVLSPPD